MKYDTNWTLFFYFLGAVGFWFDAIYVTAKSLTLVGAL